MPFQTEWYIPFRVIDERVWGKITAEAMHQHSELIVQMLSDAQIRAPGTQVHLVLDTAETESLPPAYIMLKPALPVLRFKNRGDLFHITHNSTVRSIMELTAHVMKFPMRSFATREEALQALEATMLQEDLRAVK